MKNQLRLEELAQFALILFALIAAHMPWWVYLLLLIGPDIGMMGYLASSRIGAMSYNVFHHKGLALLLVFGGEMARNSTVFDGAFAEIDEPLMIAGLILYGHASMDRIFGYGLKFGDNFHHTHLGWIGKGTKEQDRTP